MFENGKWGCLSTESLSVILTGIIVVFAMLLLLILTIKLISLLVAGFETLSKNSKDKKAAKPNASAGSEPAAQAPAGKSAAKETGTPGGVIAAISAAVAMMLGHGNFKIKGIRKADGGSKRRNAWKTAGMQDNTRPF